MVTVQDVALKAKVSIATVSRVINQTANVKDETRQRVLQAIESLGFVPSPFAQGLIKQISRSIWLIIPQVTTSTYTHIISGVERMARMNGFILYVCTTDYSPKLEEESIRQLIMHYVGGVIIASGLDNENTRRILLEARKPAVFINREWSSKEFDSFYNDRLNYGQETLKYLTSLGHREIGLLVGDFETQGNQQKLEGIHLAASEKGLEIKPELVVRCQDTIKGGSEGMSRLLANGLTTAVIAFTDALAVGGIKAVKKAGLEVPREISFICLNDTDMAQNYYPMLTTVDINSEELGKMACNRLLTRIASKRKLPSVKKKVAVRLKIRDSCTPVGVR